MNMLLEEFDQFINLLVSNLKDAVSRNIITSEWLSGQEGNRYRMLHGRMLWTLGKTGDALNYIVELDCGFDPHRGNQFRPDVQLWTKEPQLKFLIEYEGTNSQDHRALWKDLQHFSDSEGAEYLPEYWIIMYTFPNHPVDMLPPWIRNEPNFTSLDGERFKRSPHNYFKGLLASELSNYLRKDFVWEKRKLFLVNLTSTNLEIDFPAHYAKRYQFEKFL